jgi:hypothetical protein
MAIQIAGTDVFTNARQLKVRSADADVQASLRAALRENDDKIRILDSSGNPIHVYFGSS